MYIASESNEIETSSLG